ncbi:MAG: 50S ribosomal protein L4 [Pirellulaceae bacterium]|nr:50S ribosomal protein L4 [Pirellulaceae bacterium]
MVTLPIYDRTGAEVGKYEIDPAQLAPRISKQLLHDAVVMYQTNLRQGSVKTKTRSEVSGTSQKMYRQKGTGRARAGTRRSGVRRGGGHINARQPRDWSYRLPKKALRMATRMALASRIADEEVTLIDSLAFDQPKTREAAAILKALKLGETSVLVAVPEYDVNVYKSLRNIGNVSVSPVSDLNALTILRPKRVLMTSTALDAFRQAAAEGRSKSVRPSESVVEPAQEVPSES